VKHVVQAGNRVRQSPLASMAMAAMQDPPDPDPTLALAQARRLADELRRIINRLALVRPPAEDSANAADVAADFADRLELLRERSASWEVSEAGMEPRDFVEHSPLSGRSNPLAPPMTTQLVERPDGSYVVSGSVTFGSAYEGPPGHVHGGLVAAMFDELLGFAQLSTGFTASLTVRYRKPTPLHQPLTMMAWPDRVDGRKRLIKGTCHLGETLLSEAEGLFIAPRDGDYRKVLGLG
jgi:acyl-coenzyme A thioesterase PaaI-like protein